MTGDLGRCLVFLFSPPLNRLGFFSKYQQRRRFRSRLLLVMEVLLKLANSLFVLFRLRLLLASLLHRAGIGEHVGSLPGSNLLGEQTLATAILGQVGRIQRSLFKTTGTCLPRSTPQYFYRYLAPVFLITKLATPRVRRLLSYATLPGQLGHQPALQRHQLPQ